ncbi:MAG: GTP cyclohydrolase I FolE [Bacteroidia bacterium]|nr:GTP cyclohydrolase I FolE [Bacteroidia bacterium]
MKQKETTLNTQHKTNPSLNGHSAEEIGNEHMSTGVETPLRADAFKLSDEEKMKKIEFHFKEIMETLGLDLTDDSLMGTPERVAKMYVKEIFSGLNPANKPKIALFENSYNYSQMLVEKNMTFYSNCEHHFVPIFGKAHVAYISNGHVIGLSKLNRIVQYYAKRPQVQERMTMQIAKELQEVLKTKDVAVLIDARHLCVSSRGVQDSNSATVTSFYGGQFENETTRAEFLKYIDLETNY